MKFLKTVFESLILTALKQVSYISSRFAAATKFRNIDTDSLPYGFSTSIVRFIPGFKVYRPICYRNILYYSQDRTYFVWGKFWWSNYFATFRAFLLSCVSKDTNVDSFILTLFTRYQIVLFISIAIKLDLHGVGSSYDNELPRCIMGIKFRW